MKNDNQKILVLEDDPALLNAINKKLANNDFKVFQAKSMEEGLDHIKNNKDIKAIWLDHYLLGKGTGLDFVKEIKKSPATKVIPIVVVSNSAAIDKVDTYLNLGVDKYFIKSNLGWIK